MNKKTDLQIAVLKALEACDGVPMPEGALVSAVCIGVRQLNPKPAEVLAAVAAMEAIGFVQGLEDALIGKSWTLTEKGSHRAKQLR